MDLNSGAVIKRPKVTVCPITELVIKKVEQMADDQGVKSLKFFDRKKKQIAFPDADLAGVPLQRQMDEIEDKNDDDYVYEEDDHEDHEDPEYEEEFEEEDLEELLADLKKECESRTTPGR